MDNKETDRMGLVQALDILHMIRDYFERLKMSKCVDAFNVVFSWIDNIMLRDSEW